MEKWEDSTASGFRAELVCALLQPLSQTLDPNSELCFNIAIERSGFF